MENNTYPRLLSDNYCPNYIYVRDEETAFIVSFNPISRPMPGELSWPLESISKIEGSLNVCLLLNDAIEPDLTDEDSDENIEPMYDIEVDSDVINTWEGYITKYGDAYNRAVDYDKVFANN